MAHQVLSKCKAIRVHVVMKTNAFLKHIFLIHLFIKIVWWKYNNKKQHKKSGSITDSGIRLLDHAVQ